MKYRALLPSIALLVAGLGLIACGDGSKTASTAEGAYAGSLTSATSNAFELLVLENGEYWLLHGNSSGGTIGTTPGAVLYVDGFLQGTGTANKGVFTSANAADFGSLPPATGSLNAQYVTNSSIQGTITVNGNSASFAGTPIPTTTYNYHTPAKLNDIAGEWGLIDIDGMPTQLAIAANGAFTGNVYDCQFSGTFTPRPSGKNVFDVRWTFGAAPCALAGLSESGIAISNLLPGTATRQLTLGITDASRTQGNAIFGIR